MAPTTNIITVGETDARSSSDAAATGMSTYNREASKYTRTITIEHNDAFILKPIFVPDGSPNGRWVVALEPVQPFRFMDLQAELRMMVYGYLLEEPDRLKMCILKSRDRKRRPVGGGHDDSRSHRGLNWDDSIGKWTNQPPSSASIMLTSRETLQETAPLFYDKTFRLNDISAVGVFLETVGSMRKYVKHVEIVNGYAWVRGKARNTLKLLSESLNLRSFAITHTTICRTAGQDARSIALPTFVQEITATMKVLQNLRATSDSMGSILDVVTITSGWCPPCANLNRPGCLQHSLESCGVKCDDAAMAEHVKDVQARFRSMLAEALNIEE